MLGIIVYAYFLAFGFLYADRLFKDKDIYLKVWLGGIIGNVILMMGIVPFAFVFKFSYVSHILLMLLTAVPYALIYIRGGKQNPLCFKPNKSLFTGEFADSGLTNKILLFVILPITVLTCILMTNHILAPVAGGVASGQSTYGDLQMHMDIIAGLSEQRTFPPEYNILHGTRLCYPFFIDMLSASLCIFGTSIRWAILIPSYVFAFMLVIGFYCLAYSLTKRKSTAVLSTVFFFLNGAFGFAYFFEGAKASPETFTRIFTEYYKTPTNLIEMNIRWVNTICDMIVPQRTTMAGWTYVIAALWLLKEAVTSENQKNFVYLGILAGCMTMIHTHSFMALGIISAVMAVIELIKAEDKKSELKKWLLYGVIAAVIALPQLFIWTFNQAGNEGFLQFHKNWVNEAEPYIWFWVKNWGLVFLLAIPAFFNTSAFNKKLMAGCALIFVIAELIQFQPLTYDNNKLFYIVYMIFMIGMCELFMNIYDKLSGIKLRQYIAALVIITCTLSAVLTIIREWKSGADYQIYSDADIEFAEFVKENTDSSAVFMTGTYHINPVTALAGRSVYVGAGQFLNLHGFRDEFLRREAVMKSVYTSSSQSDIQNVINENNISYILVGPQESGSMSVNTSAFSGYEKVYDKNGYVLYYTGI